MTPSQYNAWLREQQRRQNDAIRRYNQEVDRVNRANRAAVEKYNRDNQREIDRVNQHNRRVVEDQNRAIQRYNQNAQSAVSKYNQVVRAHNAETERNRQNLQHQIAVLKSHQSNRYVETRTSAIELSQRFDRVQQSASSSAGIKEFLQLSEREALNSASLADALASETPTPSNAAQDTGILEYLAGFSEDLCDRWKGALFALNPANTDASRHFCTSVREIFTEIFDMCAPSDAVRNADEHCDLTPQGTPSRRAKIQYLLKRKGANSPEMLGFVEQDIEDVLGLFKVFNEATHGAAGKHGFIKLQGIRQRVEGSIMFLAAIAI